jgi:hypothetical protein
VEDEEKKVYVHQMPYGASFQCHKWVEHDDPFFHIGNLSGAKEHTLETGHDVSYVASFSKLVTLDEEIDNDERDY